MSFEIVQEHAIALAKRLDISVDLINDLAVTMPDSLDAGEGTEFIMSSVAAVSDHAGLIAAVLGATADRVRVMIDVTRGVDASTEDYFRKLSEAI